MHEYARRGQYPGTRDLLLDMVFCGNLDRWQPRGVGMILLRVGAGRDFGVTPLACLAN